MDIISFILATLLIYRDILEQRLARLFKTKR
jgi:hypothetical protein